ncbi:MAG: tRNA (guanosine(37)-N1)-methyltransferase TrmD [Candidatus Roizmanbacteria bacterium]
MRITILTLFPGMFEGFIKESIVKRAQEKNLVTIELIDLRSFSLNSYGSLDDRPYGGGAGMLMQVEPIHNAILGLKTKDERRKVILTSAKGSLFTQEKAQEYSKQGELVIIAGHYEGIDDRILDYVDDEISIGDYVLTGGELPAGIITDAVVRLLPGALKKPEAVAVESFNVISLDELIKVVGEHEILSTLKHEGKTEITLLEYPQYTRPEEYDGKRVPEVLLNGNHAEIQKWRLREAFKNTLKNRPDLLV